MTVQSTPSAGEDDSIEQHRDGMFGRIVVQRKRTDFDKD